MQPATDSSIFPRTESDMEAAPTPSHPPHPSIDDATRSQQKLEWLQALRGVAALMVVVTHARRFFFYSPLEDFAQRYMLPAAQGVDLFFLVSGFIMVYATTQSDGSVRNTVEFLIKRFARIWPVYAVMIAINAALLWTWAEPIPSLHDTLRSLAFLPVTTHSPPYLGLPLAIGWTLNFEFYFYLVFGLSLLAGRFRWLAFYAWMIASLVLVPLLLAGDVSLLADHDYRIGILYIDQNVNPIIWDFVAGTTIGLLYVSRLQIASRKLLALLIAASIALVCHWSFTGIARFHGITEWGMPLTILFATLALAAKARMSRVPRLLVWLGGISYSLYLVHPFVFTAIDRLMDFLGLSDTTHEPLFVLLIFPIPLIYAAISRRFLEEDLSGYVRQKLLGLVARRPATAATAGDIAAFDATLVTRNRS